MNRRKFWTVIAGGLLGTRLGWYQDIQVDVVGVTSDIDLSLIDLGPLIESFKKLALAGGPTTKAFGQFRKDVMSSPVFLDLEEEDEFWRMDLIPDDPDGEVIRKKMPVIGEDLTGLIDKFGLRWTEDDD